MINPDNLEIVMLIALIIILGCLVAFILNLSRRLDRQFAHIELSEAQFISVNKQINSEAVKRYEIILEKLENLRADIESVNSQAVKRYEVIWDKIENLQSATLAKNDQLIDLIRMGPVGSRRVDQSGPNETPREPPAEAA